MNGKDVSATRAAIKKAIRRYQDDGDPASIGVVVDDVIDYEANPSVVMETFAQMFRDGEVYEPKNGRVRFTHDD